MLENCKEGVPDINLTVSDVSLIVSDKLSHQLTLKLPNLTKQVVVVHVSDVHSICTRQAIRDDLFFQRRHTTQYGLRSVQYSVRNYGIVSQLS